MRSVGIAALLIKNSGLYFARDLLGAPL